MAIQGYLNRTAGLSRRRLIESMGMMALLAVGLGPILLQLVWSVGHSWFWPKLLPGEWSGRAWRYALSPEAGIWIALGNSLLIAAAVASLAVMIALPAARILVLHAVPGRRWLLFLLLLPILAPPTASTMGMHVVFLRYGLADSLIGVILAHLVPSVPYALMVLTTSLSRLDIRLEAQARTLGATWFQVWRHVTLPLIRPGLAVAFGFAFLISWSQYLSTLIIGGGRISTLPLALIAFQQSGDESIASALSLIFLAPAVLVLTIIGHWLAPVNGERGGATESDQE
ncbi:MAG: ABC transporter permease subunit [Acidobacteria bacterium]|nr:ABC transporter permease subunit [Acidobacteriota bacterium]